LPRMKTRSARRLRTLALPLLLGPLLLVGGACHRNIEPYVEGEEVRKPNLSRIFPESDSSKGLEQMGDGQPQPVMGQRGAPPAGRPSAGGPAPGSAAAAGSSGGGEPIRGIVALSPAIEDGAGSGILFIIARRGPGPPLAVLRVPEPRLPHSFEIGPDNVMIPSLQFEGEISLTARLDADGNAMTREPGDLAGEAPGVHRPGDSGITILLDRKL